MNITLGRKLGDGAFGTVYEANVEGKPKYAVKGTNGSEVGEEKLKNEDIILRYLHRDKEASISHIIKRECVFLDANGEMGLVLELLGMDLEKYARSKKTGLSLEKTRQITAQLAKALAFLRKSEVIHGDIKPENILMSADETSVTVVDFGSATFSESVYNPPDRKLQTIWYESPEVALKITATTAVDVWSLAAVIAEIYCDEVLFPSENYEEDELIAYHRLRLVSSYPADLVEKGTPEGRMMFKRSIKIEGDLRPLSEIIRTASVLKKEDPKELEDLLGKMFVYDPEKRVMPSEILEHPFLLNGQNSVKEQPGSSEEERFNYW